MEPHQLLHLLKNPPCSSVPASGVGQVGLGCDTGFAPFPPLLALQTIYLLGLADCRSCEACDLFLTSRCRPSVEAGYFNRCDDPLLHCRIDGCLPGAKLGFESGVQDREARTWLHIADPAIILPLECVCAPTSRCAESAESAQLLQHSAGLFPEMTELPCYYLVN